MKVKTRDPFFLEMISRKSGKQEESKKYKRRKYRRKLKQEVRKIKLGHY